MVIRGILKFIVGTVVVLFLALLLGVAGFFIVKSLDPNIFRVEFEKHLTQKTGLRVELGKIAFDWGPQIRLQLDGLKFYNPQSLEKMLQSDSVAIEVDLAALFRKKFWMPRATIRNPEVFVKRRADGSWIWQPSLSAQARPTGAGLTAPLAAAQPPAGSGTQGKTGSAAVPVSAETPKGNLPIAWEFGLGKIEIDDGTIHYVDETIQPAFSLDIVKCQVELIPNALLSSFHFTANASVWNVVEKRIEVEGDADLLAQVVDFSGRFDKDRVSLKGVLKMVESVPNIEGTLKIRELDLEGVVPEVYKNGEYLAGMLSSDVRLSSYGGNPEMLLKSLSGRGTIRIENGSLRNRNLVKEILEKMSPAIAVAALFGGELPAEMTGMMKGNHTDFQRATVDLTVERGVVSIPQLLLAHANYQLSGNGSYGLLDERIDLGLSLAFSRSISDYFVKKIHELRVLCDRNGLLTIPFRYAGTVPDAVVAPDLQYIGSRVIEAGAQEIITKGFETLAKILEPVKQAQKPSSGTATSSATSEPAAVASATQEMSN
jgi:uncharacterized protein involved in outer membrane biogenesis